MGSPEKPIDVELGNIDPTVITNGEKVEGQHEETVPLQSDMEKKEEEEASDSSVRFTGLKKEELMEIANQPQWKRARWFLFVIFWIVWIAMLVAAILIVVQAPKCKPIPTTEWYQDTVLYKTDPKKFAEGLENTAKHMDYFKDFKTTVLLQGVMGPDFKSVLNNEEEDFKKVVAAAEEKGKTKVLVGLDVGTLPTSSALFKKAAEAACETNATSDPACTMFYWGSAQTDYTEATDATRTNKHYKHYNNNAYIDYSQKSAVQYLQSAIDAWVDRGVAGFELIQANKNKQAEELVAAAWDHINTKHVNKTLALVVDVPANVAETLGKKYGVSNVNDTVGVPAPMFEYDSAADKKLIMRNVNQMRKQRAFYAPQSVASVLSDKLRYALTLMNLALPGVPIIEGGDEFGTSVPKFNWTIDAGSNKPTVYDTNKAQYSMTERTIKKRIADTLARKSLRYDTQNDETKFLWDVAGNDTNVVSFCRKWHKKPGVIVITNLASAEVEVTVDYKSCDESLESATIFVSSTTEEGYKSDSKLTLKDKKVMIPGRTTLMLSDK